MSRQARAFRWGQLITGIESARAQLDIANRAVDLLSDDDQARLVLARQILVGLEQRAWQRKGGFS